MPTTIVATSRIANAGAWSSRAGFGNGSFWWAVTQNTSTGKLSVWKAALGGSASEQDATNAVTNFSATHPYSCHLAANGFLYILYFTATTTLRCRRFNTATSLWETTDVGNANISASAVNTVNVRVAVRSDNDVIVTYNSTATTLSFARYEGVSWTTAAVSTAAGWINDLVMDGNDRAWFNYVDNTGNDNTYRSLDSANTLGTETDYDATAHTTDKLRGTQAIIFNDGTNAKIAVLGRDSTAEIDLYHGTTGAATIGSLATVSGITTSIVPKTTSTGLVAALGRIHACWSVASDIMYDASPNLATVTFNSTDQTILTGLTDADPCPQFISNSTYLGILYQDNGSVKVEWIIEPAPVGEIVPIAVVTATSAAITANTNINIPKPLGLADGDYLVLALESRNIADSTFQVAGGTGTWVEHSHITDPQAPTGALWGKYVVTAASEPANYTYQFNQTAATSAVLVAYRNVHPSAPIDSAPAGSSNTSTTASESVTPSVNKTRPIYASFWDASTSSTITTWPSGYNKLAITSTNARLAVYDTYQATAATTSPSDTSSVSEDWAALMLALAPAGGATTHALAGTSSGIGDQTGILIVARALAGTSAGIGNGSPSLAVARPLTGLSAGIGNQTGAITFAQPLAGVSSGIGDQTGNLIVARALAGTSSGIGNASGALVMAWALAGTSAGIGNASAALSVARPLAGTSTGVGDATAALRVARALAGVSDGIGGANGALRVAIALSGVVGGIGNGTATLTSSGANALQGVSSGIGNQTGALSVARSLAGLSTGVGNQTSTLIVGRALASTSSGVGDQSGSLIASVTISGVSAGIGGATGALSVDLAFTATPAYLARGVLTAIDPPMTATLESIDPPMSAILVLINPPFTGTLIAVDPPMQGALQGVLGPFTGTLLEQVPVLAGGLEEI